MNTLRLLGKALFRRWMQFAHVLGLINTTILLTLVFLIVVLPTKAIWVLLRKDPLLIRRIPFRSMWLPRTPDEPTLEERRHPF
jgi:hypothetical protein